jgi:MFS family permease
MTEFNLIRRPRAAGGDPTGPGRVRIRDEPRANHAAAGVGSDDRRGRIGAVETTPPPPPRRPTGQDTAITAWRDALRSTGRVASKAGSTTRRTIRRATNAQGAGESGLAKITELSGVNAAGDAAVTVALAGTLFFSAQPDQARGRVALFLLVTMIPFALLAPLIGPMLDKFRSGRRYALALTFGIRAFLAWSMVGSVGNASLWLYPAVFGVLACSRAYGVTRAAGIPRLLPPNVPLVRANSWMNMAGLLASAVAGGLGAAITHVAGPEWTLRGATVIFIVGAVLAVKLPKRVDSAADERPAAMSETGPVSRIRPTERHATYIGPSVELGLQANMAFRGLSGFLTLFLSFLLRKEHIGGLTDTAAIGLVLGAVGVGSAVGTAFGALMKQRAPEALQVLLLIAQTVVLLATTVYWGLPTVLIAGLVIGIAQTLGKLGLDAMIQRDVDEDVRSSAFARSETRLQLAWVIGGGLGTALPLRGDVGFGIASGVMMALTLQLITKARDNRRNHKRGVDSSRIYDTDPQAEQRPLPMPDWVQTPITPETPFPPLSVQHPDDHRN